MYHHPDVHLALHYERARRLEREAARYALIRALRRRRRWWRRRPAEYLPSGLGCSWEAYPLI